jgi:proteasome activator subunit 4
VNRLLERYLAPVIRKLEFFSKGETTLEKEELQRNLKLVLKILTGVSELLEPEKSREWASVLSTNLGWMEKVNIKIGGEGVRGVVNRLMCMVQDKMLQDNSDDYESFSQICYIFDMLLFCYGMDEDEIGDHIEDHKREKLHREDKLVKGKKHLPSVHLERITLQWETHLWLKNLLVLESLPKSLLDHIFSLCIHTYSEVRVVAQELLLKLVGRVGKSCHSIVIRLLVQCLANSPTTTDDTLKGALYIINSEKHMFFYSWEAASLIWPALVTAQHSDKQSVDDLLRDIGIKANRYYQDYNMYTLPLSDPALPPGVVELVRAHTGQGGEGGLSHNTSLKSQVHYQELEVRLVELVGSKTLHWRHQEMAVGMLLSMITYDHTPSLSTTSLWLSLLLSDQRTIRLMAYQALEGILKLSKMPSVKEPLTELVPGCPTLSVTRPGIRQDNLLLQYQGRMEQGQLETYWSKPFIVKSYMGYFSWPCKEEKVFVRKIQPVENFIIQPGSVRGLISEFFMDETRVKQFVEFNSLEHEKGADFFSTDRGLFLSFLLENTGPALATVFQPHIERLVGSPEESQQRAAAEMVYGLVRGSRFWDWGSTSQLWCWLLPVFQQVLNNVTAETQSDWDFCFSGVSNKADPNRLRALYELLITPENLVSQGAFKESSYLLFVAKCLSMNWRVRELYCRTYNILKDHWAHPYNNVRHQIASTMATLTAMDIPWAGVEGGNVGEGFPTKKLFIEEVIPRLNLNSPNPEFRSSRSLSPASVNTSHSSSEDVSMEVLEDEETKRANRTLEMVSLWICHQIRLSSSSLDPVLFELLPYLCQFIGTERDQDVSQSCLQALCYLSACILPSTAIQPLLDMVKRIAMSESYKTKMSMLEFLQVAVFTNFPALVSCPSYRDQVTLLTTSLLSDPHITVRQKAAKILGGLLHSGFLSGPAVTSLLCDLRGRVRTKMTRQGKRFRKEESEPGTLDKLNHHSGILGLCAFVEAFPYDVPDFVPPILMELSTHLNDRQPIPMTIKKSLQEFKRTHQDNWQEHKTKFTEDQLVVMTDLLVSQNYYA